MARRDLRSNALDALMGGAPAPRPAKAPTPPTPDEAAETAAAPPPAKSEASLAPETKGTSRSAKTRPTKPKKATGRTTDGAASMPTPAADGYVGRSRYKRKKRGVVAKLAVHLSPDVADALRRAGAVGDENGSNMSEIVEALLRRAGYGGKGGG